MMDFEKKLKEIENISIKLQREEVGINEGILLFEKSVLLAKECIDELNGYKYKIETIKQQMDIALGGVQNGNSSGETSFKGGIAKNTQAANVGRKKKAGTGERLVDIDYLYDGASRTLINAGAKGEED